MQDLKQGMQSVNTSNRTRYACILYYQVSNFAFLTKKARKKHLTFMETQTFEQNNKTTTVHTYDIEEACYPFAIVEQTEVEQEEVVRHTFEIVLGNSKAEDRTFETKEEAEEFILSKPYSLILALFCYAIELRENFQQQQEILRQQQPKPKEDETK